MSLTSATPLRGYDRRQSQTLLTLPRIEHPSKRINNDDKYSLDIRGRSRNGQGSGKIIRNEIVTPQSPRRIRRATSLKYNSEQLHDISENGETNNYGQNREQVRLPIFGKREKKLIFLVI
jgi:hypothetical protein